MLREIHTNRNSSALKKAISSFLLELQDYGHSVSIDPESLLDSMRFKRGSVEKYISTKLVGKMSKIEANLVAAELGYLINSSAYSNGTSVKERAANRETGLRIAEYFANNYFFSRAEAKEFIDGIREFADHDILLEKGYYFWEGQAYEAYKPVPISTVFGQDEYAFRKDAIETFETYENRVAAAINTVVTTMNDDDVTDILHQTLEKLSLVKETLSDGPMFLKAR